MNSGFSIKIFLVIVSMRYHNEPAKLQVFMPTLHIDALYIFSLKYKS